jgi:protein SCO1
MGISRISGGRAPSFSLTDQRGATVTLASLRGRAVVLMFFDSTCNDICPVLGKEVARAETALGTSAARVDFVAVNTDPNATAVSSAAAVTAKLGLGGKSNFYFLTGSLSTLDIVWTHYGISIEVAQATQRIAHTDLMYFIDPSGHERESATPFADESKSGASSLPATSIDRFGLGIADYARQLLS